MRSDLLRLVDHTALKPEVDATDVDRLCDEARAWGVASVCTNSNWVSRVTDRLDGSDVLTCSVVGFPLGAMHPASIADETRRAIADGATEIDMVIPVGPFQAGDIDLVRATIDTVRSAADGVVLKVILETAALTDDQIVQACQISVAAGAEFVKTSTGFHPAGGASVAAVELMRSTVGPDGGVKASGGIRTVADAEVIVTAGATRLGMSSTSALAEATGPVG